MIFIPADVTTTTSDILNFGNAATGLATGTVAVSGTVAANRINIATGSGNITVSGGTIALGGTAPAITTNRIGQIISSALTLNANSSIVTSVSATAMTLNGAIDGTGGLTFNTANVNLGGANTFFLLGAFDLNTGASWVGGSAPEAANLAKWDSTVTSPNTTVLGADLVWSGIAIENPNGTVTIKHPARPHLRHRIHRVCAQCQWLPDRQHRLRLRHLGRQQCPNHRQ